MEPEPLAPPPPPQPTFDDLGTPLADVTFVGLDPETTGEILDLPFENSHSGRSVIMATHDYTHMKKFNTRVVRCEDSKLLELSAANA